jgi:hypothetical protein
MGLARCLVDRGMPVEPFKAVCVVGPDDPAYEHVPPWERGVLHNCRAAHRRFRWWHNPLVVVRPEPEASHGALYVAGEPAGQVPVPGEDVLNLADLPIPLRRRCRAAVAAAVVQVRSAGRYVVVEGAGAAGELAADDDLANAFAPLLLGCPAALVLNANRSGHLAALIGVPELLAPRLRGLLAGYVANQIRDEAHARFVDTRLAGVASLPRLAELPFVAQPPEYDGSPERCEYIYRRRADQVSACGLLDRIDIGPVVGVTW